MKPLTPIRAIREKCLNCCGYSAHEVKCCSSLDCPLYSYRFGVRPTTAQKNNLIVETPSYLPLSEKLGASEEEGDND